jgi:Zn-dependent metalloprotease
MNRKIGPYVRPAGLLLLSLLTGLPAQGAQSDSAAARLRARMGAGTAVSMHPATGVARFVRLAPGNPVSLSPLAAGSLEAKAEAFFRQDGDLFGIQDAGSELRFAGSVAGKLGVTRLTYEQVYKGIPVFAGVLRANFDRSGRMITANGDFVPGISVATQPRISAAQAGKIALANALIEDRDGKVSTVAPHVVGSKLVIFRTGLVAGRPGDSHLTYQVEVDNKGDVHKDVFVDALSGKFLDAISRVQDALFRKAFDGMGEMPPYTNYPSNPFWVEGDPFPTGNAEADNMIESSLETYNLYENAFSYDSSGLYPFFPATAGQMHSIFDRGDGCPNASWNSTYISFCPGTTTDDITSHEWSHAFTEFTSGLIYQFQSGALNESYSDVRGETVDLINGRGLDDPNTPRTAGNCSFFTPPQATLTVNAPPSIAGDLPAGTAAFGPALDLAGITGDVVQADDGDSSDPDGPPIPGSTDDACQPLINGAQVAGKIALIQRGNCTFVIKVKNAQDAGAVAAIVYNHTDGGDAVMMMGGADATITISSLFIGRTNGLSILGHLPGVNTTLHVGSTTTDNSYRWLIGEESTAFGGAIRDMYDPNCYSNPGKVTDTTYYVCSVATDGGGVHTNSGVTNHAYALLSDGGVYNGHTVNAIGMTKAQHLWFQAQTHYLVPASDFSDMADALEQSCIDLTGINLPKLSTATGDSGPSGEVIGPTDCAAVASAIAATQLRTPPTFCNYQPLLNPGAAPLCPSGQVPSGFLFQNFESDPFAAGWTATTGPTSPDFTPRAWTWINSLPARSGSGLWAQDVTYGTCAAGGDESGVIQLNSPSITVPANGARLSFDHSVSTEATADGGNLKISVNGGPATLVPAANLTYNPYNLAALVATDPLAGEPAFSGGDGGTNDPGRWGTTVVDLTGIANAGDQIQLRFDFGQDGCGGTGFGWYVDNLSGFTCQPAGSGNPTIAIGDFAAFEGNSGTTPFNFTVTLTPPDPSGPHSVDFVTQDGTATIADNDYFPVSGTLVFAPNETSKTVSVSVVGDTKFEADETFFVSLGNATGASIGDAIGMGTILNDDQPVAIGSKDELIHDSRETRNLEATTQFWKISQKANSSYEIIVDALTGDMGATGPKLLRVDSDGSTVLQQGTSVSGGDSKSLRFENAGAINNSQFVQVQSDVTGCNPSCDVNDTFRIRAYDTTYRFSRFNNNATQVTIAIIANPTADPVTGTLWFWSGAGTALGQQAVTIPAKGAFVLNTSALPAFAGQSGTITFSNDAPYGALSGKAVAVEPATGFTFDTAMVPRPATTKMVPRDN